MPGTNDIEKLLHCFFDAGLIGMVLSTPRKEIAQFNDTFCGIVGYSRAELATMTWKDLTHVDDLQASTAQFDRLMAGEIEGFSQDKRYIRKDGNIVDVRISSKCTRKADGTVDYFITFVEDISERKQAEEMLLRYEQIVNASTDHLSFIDSNYHYLAVNQRFLDVFGKRREEVIGHSFADVLGKERFEKFSKPRLDRCLAGELIRFESLFDYAGEGRRWVEVQYLPYRREDGTVAGVIITVHDITDLKNTSEELKKHRQHLQELVAERTAELESAQQELLRNERLSVLGQLTATVGHELRNPLSAILPAVYLLKMHMQSDDKRVTSALERIERNTGRCDKIIAELLDFTRMTDFALQPLSFDAWLAEVLDEQTVPEGLTVRRELNLAGAVVRIDPDRLRRAVINVYDNACQAMAREDNPNGITPAPCLTVSTRSINNRIEIRIRDNGNGIPADVLPRIFEPLYSTKSFGMGLGLPTVKQIMTQHGGDIEIDSNGGHGTCVTLWLPLDLTEKGPGS